MSEKNFDGTREQGYGGYLCDGRWKQVAKDIVEHYCLKEGDKILDIGCAKGFLLSEFNEEHKIKDVWGVDISLYAKENAKTEIRDRIFIANAKELPFENNFFDLVISINSLHNILNVNETIHALSEIQRVTKKNSFISLGAYSNNVEKKTIDEWAVVGTTYTHEDDWLRIFESAGYEGDFFWFKPV